MNSQKQAVSRISSFPDAVLTFFLVMSLTESEMRFLQAVIESTSGPINADWNQVAEIMKLKDGKCARERWRQISVRKGWKTTSGKTGEKKKTVRAKQADKAKVKKEEESAEEDME